ncbi:conserved protein of unknown function,might belong to TPR/glycosyl transferase domain protein [Shewanella benthica]|uniref:Glycosyltransferase subfamily 4-like N-terminal domain-containing protein n=1 Tax=Shewanella benthica TaxID=43661 RepID=A0A330M5S9_9GAMM|nr:hypothetical protein [Shewanella benthica]SQH77488.1 conserved protein of unknown function,might belong to TPR/glycosyl transferase domain protein [Shewanella benthica]
MRTATIEKFQPDITFVCHYFPPNDTVGIRRVLFWVEYFSNQGKKVLVITTAKMNSEGIYNLFNENVLVVEYDFFSVKCLSRQKNNYSKPKVSRSKNKSWTSFLFDCLLKLKRKVVNPFLGQLFDPRLINCFGFSIRIKLGLLLSGFDSVCFKKTTIISTAPPWPMHLLGITLAEKYNAKLYLDYRDPFSSNHMFSSTFSKFEKKIDKYLCGKAMGVFSVSDSWVKYYSNYSEKVYLLRNGFDTSQMCKNVSTKEITITSNDTPLRIGYFGSVEHKERLPVLLLDFLRNNKPNIILEFYGTYGLVSEYVKEFPEVKPFISLNGKVKYEECLEIMQSVDINLLSETSCGESLSHRGVMPTKLYEYIGAKKPILALISHQSDMVEVLHQSGLLFSLVKDISDLEHCLSVKYIQSFEYNIEHDFIESLSRQSVAVKLGDYVF